MTLAVERDVKQQMNLNKSKKLRKLTFLWSLFGQNRLENAKLIYYPLKGKVYSNMTWMCPSF